LIVEGLGRGGRIPVDSGLWEGKVWEWERGVRECVVLGHGCVGVGDTGVCVKVWATASDACR